MSERTIRRAIDNCELAAVRIGTRVRIDPADARACIDRHRSRAGSKERY